LLNWRLGKFVMAKVGYGITCLLAAVLLVVAGFAHKEVGLTREIGKGVAISNSPSVGAMNILVMGLESRTDYQGNVLSNQLLAAMHAGKQGGNTGAQDTNTLILIHIFAGGQRAVGFSIPRDSLVQFPQAYLGESEGKIDAAYNDAYNQYINEHLNTESHDDLFLQANQAGQAATLATVGSVTGVHVDHFVEVNLAGFYFLAKAFGGVEVCLKPAPAQAGLAKGANLTDYDPQTGTDNSGFSAYKDGYNRKKGGAQYLHLYAPQALAFVRSRDTLPGVDVGRTARQQAVLDYVDWKVRHEGALSDLSVLNNLLGSAGHFLITDSTFNLLDFATNMRALTGQGLHFTTLPGTPENDVTVPGYPTPQDVYQVSVPQIQQIVKSAFAGKTGSSAKGTTKSGKTTPARAPSTVTVDVYNGNPAANGLAGSLSQALTALGYKAGVTENASQQHQAVQPGTQVLYGKGTAANAAEIATQFGATAVALKSLPAGHVEILTGSTVTTVPAGLAPSSTPSAGTQSVSAHLAGEKASQPGPTPSPSATAGQSTDVAKGARYGIPCVY
jgi:LCP family protein required for cell wall assembly